MPYTITPNAQYNSIEISFDGKPAQAVRDALKALKFRWNSTKMVWYGYASEEAARAAIEGYDDFSDINPAEVRAALASAGIVNGKVVDAEKLDNSLFIRKVNADTEKISMQEVKALLREEYAKVWDNRMTDYCTNKAASVAVLPGGEIIAVDKQGIEKDFCFGESGYDYDDAQRAAHHARTSAEYFKEKNMEDFNRWISELKKILSDDSRYMLVLRRRYARYDDCKIRSIELVPMYKIIGACGGECVTDELPGKELIIDCVSARVLSNDEIKIILSAYEQAAKAHEKKVAAYLKRYGTSKVRSWTYWRDA